VTSKVKVRTDELLAAVRARRAKMAKEYREKCDAQGPLKQRYQAAAIRALEEALAKAQKGNLPAFENSYRNASGGWLKVRVQQCPPEKPAQNTAQIDRLIATLEMAAEPTLTISAEDAARYLG
jgi:hypothetical protein